MNDKTLLRIALICSVFGIIALYFFVQNIDIAEIDIGKLEMESIGNTVNINGRISKITERDNFKIIDITKDETVSVFLFGDEEIDVSKGEYISITGELEEYNGELEIIADKIEKN